MSARKKVSFGSRGSMVETWIIDDNNTSIARKPHGDVREISRNSDCWDDRMTSSAEVVVVTQPTNHRFSNHHVMLNDPIRIVRSNGAANAGQDDESNATSPLNNDSLPAAVYPMTSQAPVMIPRYGGGGSGSRGNFSPMHQSGAANAAAVLMPTSSTTATVGSSNRSSICSNVSSNSGGGGGSGSYPYRRSWDLHHPSAAGGGERSSASMWPITSQEEYYDVLHPQNRHQT